MVGNQCPWHVSFVYTSHVRLPVRLALSLGIQTVTLEFYHSKFDTYTIIWALSSEFVSSSIPSWQTLTAHAQPFRGARDLAFCLKVPLDSLLVWASSEGSGETARIRRLAWTFAARTGYKYQIRLTRSICAVKVVSFSTLLSFGLFWLFRTLVESLEHLIMFSTVNIYIFIAIALDEISILVAVYF